VEYGILHGSVSDSVTSFGRSGDGGDEGYH